MILVGRNLSPYVRRVAITMHLTGVTHERRRINPWDDFDAVTSINPAGRVPALILDDGQVLVESTFIIDYLDQVVGPERALTPPSGAGRLQVQQLVALAVGAMDKMGMAIYEVRERPQALRHPPWLARNQAQVTSALAALDAVTQSPWLTGERMTQADVTAAVAGLYVRRTDPELLPEGRFPALDTLMARCAELAAFKENQPEI